MKWKLLLLIGGLFLCPPALAQLTTEEDLLHFVMFGNATFLSAEAQSTYDQALADHGDAMRTLILNELVFPSNANILDYASVGQRFSELIRALNVVDNEATRVFLDDSFKTISSHVDELQAMRESAESDGLTEMEIRQIRDALTEAERIQYNIIWAFDTLQDARILDAAVSRISKVGTTTKMNIVDYYATVTSEDIRLRSLVLKDGWNMISLPLQPIGSDYFDDLFSDLPLATEPISWDESNYVYEEFMLVGKGYWAKRDTEAFYQRIVGVPDTLITLNLAEGWNLIGGPHCSIGYLHTHGIIDRDEILEPNTLYTDDYGWQPANTLRTGVGYWIKALRAGEIVMDCAAPQSLSESPTPQLPLPDGFHLIRVEDSIGGNQELYFGSYMPLGWAQSYALPPKSPSEAGFDIRFSDDTRLLEASEAEVLLRSASYPLTIVFGGETTAQAFAMEELIQGKVTKSYTQHSGTSFDITDPRVTSVRIKLIP